MKCHMQNLVFFPLIEMPQVEMQHLNYVNFVFLPIMLHCKLKDFTLLLLLSGDV